MEGQGGLAKLNAKLLFMLNHEQSPIAWCSITTPPLTLMRLLTFVEIGAQRCEDAKAKKNCKTKEYHSIESNPRSVHVVVLSIYRSVSLTSVCVRFSRPTSLHPGL